MAGVRDNVLSQGTDFQTFLILILNIHASHLTSQLLYDITLAVSQLNSSWSSFAESALGKEKIAHNEPDLKDRAIF